MYLQIHVNESQRQTLLLLLKRLHFENVLFATFMYLTVQRDNEMIKCETHIWKQQWKDLKKKNWSQD